jgi:hypothetical protein
MRPRRQPQVAIWIERHNYPALKALSPNEPDWPDTYDEWLKLATEQIAKAEALGVVVNKAVIDPQEFAAWCVSSGLNPNNVTLGGYAVVLNRKKNG